MTAVYIVLIIAAVIALIIFIPIDAAFSVSYAEKNADVRLTVKYFPIKLSILPAKVKKDAEKAADDAEKEKKDIEKSKRPLSQTVELAREVIDVTWDDIKKLIRDLFARTLAVKKFYVSAKIGTGDAMYTGIAYGAANAFIYGLLGFIDNHTRLDDWRVDIDADYNGFVIEGGADITVRTRISSVLVIGFKAAIILLKILKINRRLKNNG